MTRTDELTSKGYTKVVFATDFGLEAKAYDPRAKLGAGGKACPIWVGFPIGHPRRGEGLGLTVEESGPALEIMAAATAEAEKLAQ
jgi:hypothetical protein